MQNHNIIKLLFFKLFIYQVLTITFRLSHTRQTCLYIKQSGSHEFQFILSGENPEKYTCQIYSDERIISTVEELTQYSQTIDFQSKNNKICFLSLDNEMKQVSFDIISNDDPLKGLFSVKDEQQTHLKMYAAFQELEKVYRDQKMFMERSQIYRNVLANREVKILFILIFKIIIAVVLGAYQLLLIKQMVMSKSHGFSLPQGLQEIDSEDES